MHVVELEVTPEAGQELIAAFAEHFRPAVAAQPGFRSVRLLRPRDGAVWLLLIDFASDEERLAWVATALHEEAWPAIARFCDAAVGADFDEVAG